MKELCECTEYSHFAVVVLVMRKLRFLIVIPFVSFLGKCAMMATRFTQETAKCAKYQRVFVQCHCK